jgi:AmiR/NasT family two-component response regulator
LEPEDEIAHLRLALRRRTTIGVALGILMERHSLDQEEAFHLLSAVASKTERKVHDVATHLVESGHLPGPRLVQGASSADPEADSAGT